MSEGLLTLRSGTDLTHEIEIKRSRFIARIARTDSPEEARALIDLVRQTHPQARHTCSAFLIHEDGHSPHQHSNDDGEPSGTAGTPMLEALRASGVWNVTAVVTRYFGGILLGGGGLVRAYSGAVSQALALADRAQLRTLHVLESELDPAQAGRIEAEIRNAGAHVIDTTWGLSALLRIGADAEQEEHLSALLARLTHGNATFRHTGTMRLEVDAT